MAKIYVRRIKAGLMTLEDVPAIWQPERSKQWQKFMCGALRQG